VTKLKFWNTTIDDTLSMSSYTDEWLIEFLEDLVTHDTYNNGGQLHPDTRLGQLYDKVVREILARMAKGRQRE
jgi:hypothetical protein